MQRYPGTVVPADVTGDSRVDLLVSGYGTLWAFNNQGDGGFVSQPLDPAMGLPWVDLDGDGAVDWLVSPFQQDDPYLLAYHALDGGVVVAPLPGPAGAAPLAAGDLTGDGAKDLLLATPELVDGGPNVVVMQNSGNRMFAPGLTLRLESMWSLALVDLNGDGTQDLVGGNIYDSELNVWLSPAFTLQTYSTTLGALSVCTGDFNGDAHQDVVATTPGGLSYDQYLNDGTGGLLGPTPVHFSSLFPRTCVAGRINGDALDDLVVTAEGGFEDIAVQLGTAANGVGAPGQPFNIGQGAVVVALEQMLGGPAADMVLVDRDEELLNVLSGNGDGTFELPAFPAPVVASQAYCHALLDVTGDGSLDLVTGTPTGMDVRPGDGLGGFAPGYSTALAFIPLVLVPVNLNGDLFMDALALAAPARDVVTLVGSASGLTEGGALNATDITALAAGDANNDQLPDLAVLHDGTSNIGMLAGQPGGGFAPEVLLPLADGTRYNPVVLANLDSNADGVRDFMVVSPQDFDVTVITIRNQAGQWQQQTRTLSTFADVAGLGDLNGDGRADVVTSQINAREVTLFEQQASGAFVEVGALTFPGGVPRQTLVVDVDGDSHNDVAVVTRGGQLTVFLGNGTGGFGPPATFLVPQRQGAFSFQDVTGDQHPDLWVLQASGELSLHVARAP